MSSIQIDRTDGLSSSTAVKGPCRLASPVNIPILSGLLVVDGVQTMSGDRVVLTNQTSSIQNGVYVVDTGMWRRSADFNKTRDVIKGTRVWVVEGNSGPADLEVTSDNPVRVGVDNILFELSTTAANAAALSEAVREASDYADFARNNWAIVGPFTGTGVTDDIYPLTIDPGSPNNMFPIVGGVAQLLSTTPPAYQLVYVATLPKIKITVPLGVPFEVRISNAIPVLTPSDGSVTTPKIPDGAVTDPKLASAQLKAISALVTVADRLPYSTALNTWALTTFTSFARTLLAAVDAAAARAVLGLGSMAVLSVWASANAPNGAVVGSSPVATYTANANITGAGAVIPLDDTIPQIGEGVELISVSYTPSTITNKLRIRARGLGAESVVSVWTAAIFNGAANALSATTIMSGSIDTRGHFTLEAEYTPGVLTAQTISLRVGVNTSTHILRMNGFSTARELGGSQAVTLVVEEIKA